MVCVSFNCVLFTFNLVETQVDNNMHIITGEGNMAVSSDSNGILEAMTYAGVTYYERDGIEDLLIFSAAKKLNALLQVNTLYEMSYFLCVVY